MTLIEVVIGLALLGTLLVGLLTARSALSRQRIEADKRLVATRICDELLAEWTLADKGIPRKASGNVGQQGEYRWTTSMVRVQRVADQAFDVVKLQVIDGRGKLLTSVEVLVPERKGI